MKWKSKSIEIRADRKNYPAAPSAGLGILKLYEELFLKALGRKKKAKVLVLGATSESRDLVLKHGHKLITADINMESISKWSNSMKFKNHPDETIVKCNWLNIPLENNYFDLIMGDGVSNNIFLEDQDKFFREIKRLLKPNGFVILRESVISHKRKIKKIEEIDSDFMSKKNHWFDAFFDFMLYSDIVPRFYNKKTCISNINKIWEVLTEHYKRGRISKNSLETVSSWYKNAGVRVFMLRPKLEKLFKKYFKLIPVKQTKDYKFTQDTMIFFFGRNKK